MPGMGSGLSANNSTIVSAFRTALLHQGLIVLAILAIVVLTWNLIRANQIRALSKAAAADGPRPLPATDALPAIGPEPAVRRLLRIGFGLIWVLDGLLQAQSAMPLGMIPQVVQPTAQASPAWVQHLVNAGGTIWNNHPIEAAAAAVWIQLGIGLWLLIAPRGLWSRLGGVASVFWGVLVWIFGESFGGIFAPGASWLFGTPGAVLFYCAAGVIVALPDRSFTSARLGRVVLGVMGTFFIGMAVLEAWPGRGFWQGASHGRTVGTLTSMVQSMVTTPQPKVISSSLNAFASFDAAHGFAVNLFVVVALGAIGLAFLSGRPAVVRLGVGAAAVVCLADWVLVQDFGFLGGVGTDPNSMVPMLLVIVGGYLALVKPLPVVAEAAAERRVEALGAIEALRRRATAQPAFLLRALAALGAIGVVTVGALPMALASVNPNADPIVAEAIDGSPNALNTPAPAFHLVDQRDQPVSLAGLRNKTVVLTFLDPVCTSDCPIIAQEFRQADASLGAASRHVVFIAVVANPLYRSVSATQAFDRAEGMSRLANWLFLTGSVGQLQRTWNEYGVQVSVESAGAMIAHSDLVYIINGHGHTRYVLDSDPGPGTQATKASFSTLLTASIENVLPAS
ncbi:MAG: SCO family protein [Acidimicrobiales bacterium]|jgi:cytochrome oxidase Cu insertion factor (SCO1/SenC/PrrC family)